MTTQEAGENHAEFAPGELLSRTFEHVVAICGYLSQTGLLDEETITGSLLGSLVATAPLLAQSMAVNSQQPQCCWARYNKGTARNTHSEAANGADFALVIIDGNGTVRVAIFQAKRKYSYRESKVGETINVHHMSTDAHGEKRPQMIALVEAALALMGGSSLSSKAVSSVGEKHYDISVLTWVHYLAYVDGEPRCLLLSSLGEALRKEQSTRGKDNLVSISTESTLSFLEILLAGVSNASSYWLTLSAKDAFNHLPKLFSLMPVIAVGDRESWKHVPEDWKNAAAPAVRQPQLAPSGKSTKLRG